MLLLPSLLFFVPQLDAAEWKTCRIIPFSSVRREYRDGEPSCVLLVQPYRLYQSLGSSSATLSSVFAEIKLGIHGGKYHVSDLWHESPEA